MGGADTSWAFDGHLEAKEHMGIMEAYGKRWHVGDIVGVFLDLVDRTISERVIHRVGNLATLQDAHIFHRVARFLSLYCGLELSRSSRARLFSFRPDEEVSLFTRYLSAEWISVRK